MKRLKLDKKLLKLGFFNSVSLSASAIIGIGSTKVLAIFLGVQEFGLFGIYRDFLMLLSNISSLGISNGIIKYTSEKKNKSSKLTSFISSLWVIAIANSLFFGVIMFCFASYFSTFIFKTYLFAKVFYWLGVWVFFIVFHTFIIAIFKGLGLREKVIFGNVLNAIILLALYILFVPNYSLEGAIVASLISFAITSLYYLLSFPYKLRSRIKFAFESKHLKDLSAYAGMVGFSLFAFPIMGILIKNVIYVDLGAVSLSYWEALNRISNSYTMFGFSLLSLFVIPKLSEDSSYTNYKTTMLDFLFTIFPFFLLLLMLIYISREPFVRLLLSEDYNKIQIWMKWFFLGDIFRILALLFATYFHATRSWKQYIISDVFLIICQYVFIMYLTKKNGLSGGAIGYCIAFVLYFFLTMFLVSQMQFFKERKAIAKKNRKK